MLMTIKAEFHKNRSGPLQTVSNDHTVVKISATKMRVLMVRNPNSKFWGTAKAAVNTKADPWNNPVKVPFHNSQKGLKCWVMIV